MKMLPPAVRMLPSLVREPPRERDPFYNTPEYRDWARLVKQRAGWRCEAVDDGRRCDVKAPARLYADHIVERRAGGADLELSNGQCLCHGHHETKRWRDRAAPVLPAKGV